MRQPHISLCPEGFSAIVITGFSTLLFAILGWWIPALGFWLLFLFSMHFFRDPDRVAPEGADIAASPADGTVVNIATRADPFTNEQLCCISIFMSVFNVHVNRSPVNCTVQAIRYFPGKFINASFDKASLDNERCAWSLQDNDGIHWSMVQIAGLIARRIVCRAEVGDRVKLGERLGMIRFGSRVDLYLPDGYSPTIGIGTKVFAGQTVVARKNASRDGTN